MSDNKLTRQLPWQNQTQTIGIIALALVVAITIGALYLAQATVTATAGRQIENLSATDDALQRANEDMVAQIAIARSLDLLRGRAQALGFVPVDSQQLEYLVVNGYVPTRATPTPMATPVPTFVYDETFDGWVKQQWDAVVKQFEAWMGHSKSTPTPAP